MSTLKTTGPARSAATTATEAPAREVVRVAVGALDGAGSILPDRDETDARDPALAAMAEQRARTIAVQTTDPASGEVIDETRYELPLRAAAPSQET